MTTELNSIIAQAEHSRSLYELDAAEHSMYQTFREAMETINNIQVVNQCTEEMAAVKIACDETSDMSYL